MKKTYFEDKMTVKFPAWDYDVQVVLTSNIDASIKRRDPNHDEGTAAAVCMHNTAGNPNCMIVLQYGAHPSTIAHESWHAVKRLLDFCGADYESETVAYHLGHLVGRITDFSRKHPHPPKRRPNPLHLTSNL